jgi:hypothetical protein
MTLWCCIPAAMQGQDPFSDAVQTHVDHIEEFIERFNFQKKSRFYDYTRRSFPDHDINRGVVVNALFNRRITSIDREQRESFVKNVTNPGRPVFLEIYDALWYATVPVEMTVGKEKIEATVTLEIQLNRDYSIEWTVIGVVSEALRGIEDSNDLFISASSHATYFPELRQALSSATDFESIISDSQKGGNALKFKRLIDNKEVTDVKILNGIRYHFLQIPDWVMVVDYAPQDYSLNTGWLISDIRKVESFLDKRVYQWEHLGIMSSE